MRSGVFILLFLFLCLTAEAQRKKSEVKTYSACEVENCYSSYSVRFKQDSTVWVSSRLHQYSSNFTNVGTWREVDNTIVIQIKNYKRKTKLTNLNGAYYKVVKPECEFLIKEGSVADTTEIIEAGAKHLKSEMEGWQPNEKAESTRKVKSIMMSSFIRFNYSWKSNLLVLDIEK